jgi:hypothetical protein
MERRRAGTDDDVPQIGDDEDLVMAVDEAIPNASVAEPEEEEVGERLRPYISLRHLRYSTSRRVQLTLHTSAM